MKYIFPLLFLLNSCVLRLGVKGDYRVGGVYPPVDGIRKLICVPCFQFQEISVGIMFFGSWPVFVSVEEEGHPERQRSKMRIE